REALSERAKAEAAEHTATSRLDEIRRLADVKRLRDYEAAAEELWPSTPEKVPAMKAWLAKAWPLAARLPLHRAKLAEMRALALPYDDAARAHDRASHPDAERLAALLGE